MGAVVSSRYEHGRGVRKSREEAAGWYRKAAEQGHAAAECNLEMMEME